jgi:hypothetical protein
MDLSPSGLIFSGKPGELRTREAQRDSGGQPSELSEEARRSERVTVRGRTSKTWSGLRATVDRMRRETRSGGGRLHRRDRRHNAERGKLRDGLQSEGGHRGRLRWRSSGDSNRWVTFDWSVLRLIHHAGNRADGAEVKLHGGFGETARKLEQAGGTETCPSGFRREIR